MAAHHSPPLSRLQVLASSPYLRSSATCTVPDSCVTLLKGHASEVMSCAWNPKQDILASIAADSTARLWDFSPDKPIASASNHKELTHCVTRGGREEPSQRDVSAMDWNRNGTHLLTGCFFGFARVWDVNGQLERKCGQHKSIISAVKWNKNGDRFITASADKSVAMWHASTGSLSQKFAFHSAAVLDVDWKNNSCFASCSTDTNIYICELARFLPHKRFKGHTDDVNSVRWDPQSVLLASCSDDFTLKLWSMDAAECLRTLEGHSDIVYRVQWSPTGPKTQFPNAPVRLASAGFDSTVRLWDVETGACLRTMTEHSRAVHGVAFSPDGQFVASGSVDNRVHIWSVENGRLLQTYEASSPVYDVAWNQNGTFLGASSSDGTVIVIDMRY